MMRFLLLAALLCLGGPSLAQPANNGASANTSAQQAASSPMKSPAITAATSRQIETAEEAEPNQPDPYAIDRDQRERRNVEAQERMAKWTRAAFWAIVAQTILAGGALTALILDLRQNRFSAERQIRAYLDFDGVTWLRDEERDSEGKVFAGIRICIKNFGQTPAENVSFAQRYLISLPNEDEPRFLAEQKPEIVGSVAPTDTMTRNGYFELPTHVHEAIRQRITRFVVEINIEYVDAFDRKRALSSMYESNALQELTFIGGTRKTG